MVSWKKCVFFRRNVYTTKIFVTLYKGWCNTLQAKVQKNNQITINTKIKNKINIIIKFSPSYLYFWDDNFLEKKFTHKKKKNFKPFFSIFISTRWDKHLVINENKISKSF